MTDDITRPVGGFSNPTTKEVLDRLRELAADPSNCDGANGGLSPVEIAEDMDVSGSTIRPRLRALKRADRVVKVRGISPKGKPRASWLPADHPDARTVPDHDIPRHPSDADD